MNFLICRIGAVNDDRQAREPEGRAGVLVKSNEIIT